MPQAVNPARWKRGSKRSTSSTARGLLVSCTPCWVTVPEPRNWPTTSSGSSTSRLWWPQSDGNVGSWLCRTAANLGIDTLRARARRERYEQAAARAQLQAGAPADPLEEVLRAERARLVRAALAELKPAQAQILILRASGLSYKELAEGLKIKLATVGKMLVRAEAAFEKQFREVYGNEEGS